MKAPSDQCAFSGWMEISGPQLSWEKPKISPTSWAWAVMDSLSPWPPQVSESTSVQGQRVLPRSQQAEQVTRGQAKQGCSSQLEEGGLPRGRGPPQCCRVWQERRGSPCLSPLFNNASSFTSSFPFQICRLCSVARSRPECCLGQQTRGCTGTANQGAETWTGTFLGP